MAATGCGGCSGSTAQHSAVFRHCRAPCLLDSYSQVPSAAVAKRLFRSAVERPAAHLAGAYLPAAAAQAEQQGCEPHVQMQAAELVSRLAPLPACRPMFVFNLINLAELDCYFPAPKHTPALQSPPAIKICCSGFPSSHKHLRWNAAVVCRAAGSAVHHGTARARRGQRCRRHRRHCQSLLGVARPAARPLLHHVPVHLPRPRCAAATAWLFNAIMGTMPRHHDAASGDWTTTCVCSLPFPSCLAATHLQA